MLENLYLMKQNRLYISLFASVLAINAAAQENLGGSNGITVTGSIQSDILIPQDDKRIGTEETSDWGLTNTYVELNAMSEHLDAGLRMEYLQHPLPGFEKDFRGWGVPFAYLKAHFDNTEVTLGSFYEQFGSGFILRTYEERSLGIDNSLVGGKIVTRPVKGVQIKALAGMQRRYWTLNKGCVSGADLELGLDQWFRGMQKSGTALTLGASWVNKYQKADEEIYADPTHMLNLPSNVNAFDVRANFQKSGFSILGEYAWKTDDPSYDNGYIYRKGTVAMLSTSYSKSGMSILLQAKRSDNMSFRSERSRIGSASFINNLPAFTMEQTYALAALYPYATQPGGEWAYQAELGYKFKRNTFLGGKYGTSLKVNFSHVHGIDRNEHGGKGTDGYGSAFWKWGDHMNYQDLNVQIEKKWTKSFQLNLMYMNQFYNNSVLKTIDREDKGEVGMVHSNIFIAEGKYRFNRNYTLRAEAQYLTTGEAQGDWLYGLLELSILPHFMITASDMYNAGETHLHYYQGFVTFTTGSHRIQAGYGRTRAGYNCSGGVCRYVPASKGFTLSYNYNF